MQDFPVAETPSSQRMGHTVWIPDQGTRPHRLQPRVYMWQQDPVRVCVISPISHVTAWPQRSYADCYMDCSPLGSSLCGILQARILEWVAMPSCSGSSQPRD